MKKEVTLYADKGMMLTDGRTFGTVILVEVDGDSDKYYEITEEEYNEIQKKLEAENTAAIEG